LVALTFHPVYVVSSSALAQRLNSSLGAFSRIICLAEKSARRAKTRIVQICVPVHYEYAIDLTEIRHEILVQKQ
jgi:hypothetical protein